MMECFGPEISGDRVERNHRFLEESLEVVHANGCTREEARQLVEYVYGRPTGELHQEIGGAMVTLAALCLAVGKDMHQAGEDELARIWTKVEQIRAKQAAKPRNSPLPESPAPVGLTQADRDHLEWIVLEVGEALTLDSCKKLLKELNRRDQVEQGLREEIERLKKQVQGKEMDYLAEVKRANRIRDAITSALDIERDSLRNPQVIGSLSDILAVVNENV
jgi:hypothetical protein